MLYKRSLFVLFIRLLQPTVVSASRRRSLSTSVECLARDYPAIILSYRPHLMPGPSIALALVQLALKGRCSALRAYAPSSTSHISHERTQNAFVTIDRLAGRPFRRRFAARARSSMIDEKDVELQCDERSAVNELSRSIITCKGEADAGAGAGAGAGVVAPAAWGGGG